ncbi:cytochrome b/b6 domain-containing protein [Thioclava sp. FR2]|uniref:cytochrome b/b6 domain-containing protein n=1 Tax=Thioclava sp. FR2 TaxID=3445780 RepID=UPI003EB99AC0
MTARNSPQHFGWVARLFHWLTALLILTAIPLGLYANSLPFDTSEALSWKAQVFSVHKTLGIAAFFLALGRILWAVTGERPAPLHPDRKAEMFVAHLVHWLLYLSMLIVPLSGWIHHAAVTGFAPILWPFGQDLPLVPKSEALGEAAAAMHWLFTKLLAVSIILHVAGALKHHVIDKDATLRRMTRGERAPHHPVLTTPTFLSAILALVLYAGAAAAVVATAPRTDEIAAAPLTQPAEQSTAGNWQVTDGSLAFAVKQMGQTVNGSFGNWSAEISFDETPVDGRNGQVTVQIDTGSLTLGSVTDQAKGNDFFNVTSFPQAIFSAEILPEGGDYIAKGTLTLRGIEQPVDLPFTLTVEGNTATMSGQVTLDRRAFEMGKAYADESNVGFAVVVDVNLTATRSN